MKALFNVWLAYVVFAAAFFVGHSTIPATATEPTDTISHPFVFVVMLFGPPLGIAIGYGVLIGLARSCQASATTAKVYREKFCKHQRIAHQSIQAAVDEERDERFRRYAEKFGCSYPGGDPR